MSLTVKAFLEKDGKFDGEIRRVAIPADVSSSYAYLTKKIEGIFPSLVEGHFSLHWKGRLYYNLFIIKPDQLFRRYCVYVTC